MDFSKTDFNRQYNKGVIRNLRDQSPYSRGKKNQDFVNPSLTSNVVFYNHGKEKVDNPHYQPTRHEYAPNGYNLNNYVGYDVKKKTSVKGLPVKEEARSVRTGRHYDKSLKSKNSKVNLSSKNRSTRSRKESDMRSQKSDKSQ